MKRKTDANAGLWGQGKDALFSDHPCRRAALPYTEDVVKHELRTVAIAVSRARTMESSYVISNGVYSGFSFITSQAWEWRNDGI